MIRLQFSQSDDGGAQLLGVGQDGWQHQLVSGLTAQQGITGDQAAGEFVEITAAVPGMTWSVDHTPVTKARDLLTIFEPEVWLYFSISHSRRNIGMGRRFSRGTLAWIEIHVPHSRPEEFDKRCPLHVQVTGRAIAEFSQA